MRTRPLVAPLLALLLAVPVAAEGGRGRRGPRPTRRQRSADIRHLRKGLFHWKVQDVPEAFWRQYEEDVGLQDAFVRVAFHPNWGTRPRPWCRSCGGSAREAASRRSCSGGCRRRSPSSEDDALSGSDQAWKRWAVAMPRDEAAFRAFVRGVIEHWNGKEKLGIGFVEIGNEPDLPEYWRGTRRSTSPSTGCTPRRSGRPILDPHRGSRVERVGRRDPGARREAFDGPRAGPDPEPDPVLRGEPGAPRLVSWHFWTPGPYEPEPEPVATTRRWLAEAGLDASMPLVVDEWAGALPSAERPNSIADSEAEAAYGAAEFVTMADAGIDRQAKTCLFDDLTPDDAHPLSDLEGRSYGIVTWNGVTKPVYNVFRMLAELGPEQVALERSDGPEPRPALRPRQPRRRPRRGPPRPLVARVLGPPGDGRPVVVPPRDGLHVGGVARDLDRHPPPGRRGGLGALLAGRDGGRPPGSREEDADRVVAARETFRRRAEEAARAGPRPARRLRPSRLRGRSCFPNRSWTASARTRTPYGRRCAQRSTRSAARGWRTSSPPSTREASTAAERGRCWRPR